MQCWHHQSQSNAHTHRRSHSVCFVDAHLSNEVQRLDIQSHLLSSTHANPRDQRRERRTLTQQCWVNHPKQCSLRSSILLRQQFEPRQGLKLLLALHSCHNDAMKKKHSSRRQKSSPIGKGTLLSRRQWKLKTAAWQQYIFCWGNTLFGAKKQQSKQESKPWSSSQKQLHAIQ